MLKVFVKYSVDVGLAGFLKLVAFAVDVGVAFLLTLAVGFGVGVTAKELAVNNVVVSKTDMNTLIFIVYSI